MIVIIGALAAAILVSSLLSAAELSIFMLTESRVRALAEQGRRGATALVSLRARPERTLVLLRLVDAAADVSTGVFTAFLGFQAFHLNDPSLQVSHVVLGFAALVAAVSLVAVYLGELIPLGLAANHGVRLSLMIAPTVLFFTGALSPLLVVIARLANIRSDRRENNATITESGVRQLSVLGHTEELEEHERELIERAFQLDDAKAWEVMTPRVDVFAWRDAMKLADIADEIGAAGFSRVPVYGENIDDITGVLHARDAYEALLTGQKQEMTLRELAREPLIVPGSLSLTKLLRYFQTRRIHMAIVVDEYGGTDGVVTLEDVIEELVGPINDETDEADTAIVRVSRTEVIADGDTDLRDINQMFNTSLSQQEHRSVNGYLLEELGHVPEPGEKLEREGILIEVVEATDTQVTRARFRRIRGGDGDVSHVAADDDALSTADPSSELHDS
jgi:CBS domain containing-hemolysin-like protein